MKEHGKTIPAVYLWVAIGVGVLLVVALAVNTGRVMGQRQEAQDKGAELTKELTTVKENLEEARADASAAEDEARELSADLSYAYLRVGDGSACLQVALGSAKAILNKGSYYASVVWMPKMKAVTPRCQEFNAFADEVA